MPKVNIHSMTINLISLVKTHKNHFGKQPMVASDLLDQGSFVNRQKRCVERQKHICNRIVAPRPN
jgi:hypothetical protein